MKQKKRAVPKCNPDQNVKAGIKDKFILSTEQSKSSKPLRYFLLFWHPVKKMLEIPGIDDIDIFLQQRSLVFYQLRPSLHGKEYHFLNDELLTVEKYLSSVHGHAGVIKQQEFLCLYKDRIIEKMNGSNINACESIPKPALALMFFYLFWVNYFSPPDPDYYKNRRNALQVFAKDFKIGAVNKFWESFNWFSIESNRINPNTTEGRRSAINSHYNYFEKILPILQSKSHRAFNEAMKDYSTFKSRYPST